MKANRLTWGGSFGEANMPWEVGERSERDIYERMKVGRPKEYRLGEGGQGMENSKR